jgi:SAM-dependent methyltransferase
LSGQQQTEADTESTEASEFVPHSGQAGKDVIWVPTPEDLVAKMLELAEVTSNDYVIDLGSGDGRTVIAAAKLGAKALGIEFNPDMVELSEKNAIEAGVAERAKFKQQDLFEADLSEATVITMFLLPDINRKLRPKLLDLKPGTRIVSNTFSMGEWEADSQTSTDKGSSWSTALMWIIPAKVDGTWSLANGELTLKQEFQKISGEYKNGTKSDSIREGKLTGEIIKFRVDDVIYTGKVDGDDTMSGTYTTDSGNKEWNATRKTTATRTSIAGNQ